MTGGPGKEQGTNKPPPTGRVGERSGRHHMSDRLPESSLASILAEQGVHHQEGLGVRWLAKDNPETNPITIKPETASHVAELFSWVPLPYCSPPGWPFEIKSLALSAHVSSWTIHFRVLDKSPVLCPGTGPPFCNKTRTATCSQIHIISLHPGTLSGNSNCNFWCLTHRTEVLLGTFSQLGLQMCCVRGLPSAV